MKKYIQSNLKFFGNPLIIGSAFVFAGSFFVNILSYLFQLLAGRFLTVADYGILVSLFSLIAIIGVPSNIVNTAIIKIVSELKAKRDFDSITSLFIWLIKVFLGFAISIVLVSFLLNKGIIKFLNFDKPIAFILFILFFAVGFLLTIPISFLQGLMRFKVFALANIVTALNKLLFGIGFTLIFYEITGTVTGMFLGAILSLILAFFLLRKNLSFGKEVKVIRWVKRMVTFALPSSLSLISLAILFNSDVILVKHFFSQEVSGIYSSLAIVGRILFFGSSSISLVLFPIASEGHAKGEDTKHVFFQSLILTSFLLVIGFLVFSLVPNFVIQVLFGSTYLPAAPYLAKFSIFMLFYTLVFLLTQYFLSTYRTKVGIFLALGAFVQVLLVWFKHSSLEVVVNNLIYVNGALFLILMGYYFVNRNGFISNRSSL